MPCITLSSGKSVCFGNNEYRPGGKTYPPMNSRVNNIPTPTTQDSTNLYNAQIALTKFYDEEVKKGKLKKMWVDPYIKGPYSIPQRMKQENLKFYNDEIANRKVSGTGLMDNQYKKTFGLNPNQIEDLEKQGLQMSLSGNNNQYYYRDLITPMQNLAAPFAMFDSRIAPQRLISYMPIGSSSYPGGAVDVFDYDPFPIKPFHLRTPEENVEWEKKYGKSQPKSKTKKTLDSASYQNRETLETLPMREVPRLTSNFTIEPRSISVPSAPQSSDEEYNRKYSLRIPTIDINKRQVAPRVNRVLGKNMVNPRNQYQRSIEFGSREIPITDDYHLNKALMKMGMEPKFNEGGKTGEWMGNKLDEQGFVTSTTKGGNRVSFTGNARSDEWINKQIDTGKFGYNPKTGTVVKLDKPVQGLSKEDKIKSTYEFGKFTVNGFPTREQEKEISKLPQETQDLINETNERKRRESLIRQNREMVQNPAFYAPGAAFFGGLAAPYIGAGLEAAMAALELPAVVGGTTLPILTGNNVLGLAGGIAGANMLGSDLDTGYYSSDAPMIDKVARGLETGVGLGFSPGMMHGMTQMMGKGLNVAKTPFVNLRNNLVGDPKINMEIHNLFDRLHNTPYNTPEHQQIASRLNYYLRRRGSSVRLDLNRSPLFSYNEELPPPPSEIILPPQNEYVSGSYRPSYASPEDLPPPPPDDFWDDIVNSSGGPTEYIKPNPINRSGLTKEEVLQKAAPKDKDLVSKMSEDEFSNTVLKPTGEIVSYQNEDNVFPYFTGNNTIYPLSNQEFADKFNQNIHLLKDIVKKRNKSGVEYIPTELDPNGSLRFYTPEQEIPVTLTEIELQRVNEFNENPVEFLKNRAGLRKVTIPGTKDEVYILNNGDTFDSVDDVVKFAKDELFQYTKPKKISGETSWSVRINPGEWRGNVEDIANTEYFRSIPGLEMRNTLSGVFPESSGLKGTPGTKAYESINEYLKLLDLGRVKPGFNSQTETIKDASGKIIQTGSKDVWENFIKSGRGVGFYANPNTVYGTMKTLAPYLGAGYLGYKGLNYLPEIKEPVQRSGGKNTKTITLSTGKVVTIK